MSDHATLVSQNCARLARFARSAREAKGAWLAPRSPSNQKPKKGRAKGAAIPKGEHGTPLNDLYRR